MSLGPSLQLHVIGTISTATNCCHCLYLYIPLIVSSYMPLVQSLQLHTIGYLSLSLQLHAIDKSLHLHIICTVYSCMPLAVSTATCHWHCTYIYTSFAPSIVTCHWQSLQLHVTGIFFTVTRH